MILRGDHRVCYLVNWIVKMTLVMVRNCVMHVRVRKYACVCTAVRSRTFSILAISLAVNATVYTYNQYSSIEKKNHSDWK